MVNGYGSEKFKGIDKVTDKDIQFLKCLTNYVEHQVNEERRYIYQNNDVYREYLKKDKDRLSHNMQANINSNRTMVNKLKSLKVIMNVGTINDVIESVVNQYIVNMPLKDKGKYSSLMKLYEQESEEKYRDNTNVIK